MTHALRDHLEQAAAFGQAHIVEAAARLDDAGMARLCASLDTVPWSDLDDLLAFVKSPAASAGQVKMTPPVALQAKDAEAHVAQGESLLERGAVAVFTVAGGQGTRLGWNGPKGTYPATPITGTSLFGVLAARIKAASRRYGAPVRWYIMTSEANHDDTLRFFTENRFFGLDRANVQLFRQGMMPAFDADTGELLLAGPDQLATSPDGHGGSYAALLRSGAIEHMQHRGVEQLAYVQIDNPLVRAVDPGFIGLHVAQAVSDGSFSSKIVGRAHAAERVGVFVQGESGMQVVEYSDLDEAQAAAVDANGQLVWRAANIAVHMMSLDFLHRMATGGTTTLPWHRAYKKVPWWDVAADRLVEPDAPNAIKLERFVFDALPMAGRSVLLEVDREDEFAPIKNAQGDDSPESSAAMQCALHASWLRAAGVDVADSVKVEISPEVAQWPADLQGVSLPGSIDATEPFLLNTLND